MSETGRLDTHVILVGLPGSGKSSLGRRLAKRIGSPFLDFDIEIEKRTGLSIPQLFTRHGEQHFRELERQLTEELALMQPAILAPGGGWITVPGAMALLRPPARMIYLRVAPEVAILRMGARRAIRPLLEVPDPLAALHELLEQREPAYRGADHVVDAEMIGMKALTEVVARLVVEGEGPYV